MTSVNALGFDKDPGQTRVVAAMSGGVNSAVVAAKNALFAGFQAPRPGREGKEWHSRSAASLLKRLKDLCPLPVLLMQLHSFFIISKGRLRYRPVGSLRQAM